MARPTTRVSLRTCPGSRLLTGFPYGLCSLSAWTTCWWSPRPLPLIPWPPSRHGWSPYRWPWGRPPASPWPWPTAWADRLRCSWKALSPCSSCRKLSAWRGCVCTHRGKWLPRTYWIPPTRTRWSCSGGGCSTGRTPPAADCTCAVGPPYESGWTTWSTSLRRRDRVRLWKPSRHSASHLTPPWGTR